MHHDVVGVRADQHVGEDVDVQDGPQALLVQAAQRCRMAGTVQRHGRHPRPQFHGPADPGSREVIVVAALRGTDPAQLGMDRRAVIALVVVLGENLPVGGGIVFVPAGDHEPAHLVRRQHGIQRPKCVVERCGHASAIHEDEAVPLDARQLDQAPLTRVEARLVLEARSRAQAPVKAVRPRVVRADDHALGGSSAARQQLMTAVPAGVREGVQDAVVVPGQQHAADARCLGALVTGVSDLVAAADAHPAAAEEVPLLPLEHGRIGVGGAGQHPALAERAERLGQSRRVERDGGRVVLAHHTLLTDHTVNAKRRAAECLASGFASESPHVTHSSVARLGSGAA